MASESKIENQKFNKSVNQLINKYLKLWKSINKKKTSSYRW